MEFDSTEKTIIDRMNGSYYWFECQNCNLKTDDYLKQYRHKTMTGHKIMIKSILNTTVEGLMTW